jgi:lipase
MLKDGEPRLLSQDIGDATIQYLHYEGGGPPLIFLHATGFLPWLWHPIARQLAPHYRIFAPYFCDHRLTEPEEGGLDWMTLADDLCAFCRGLGLANPFLVGHSMGATVMTIGSAVHGLPVRRMILVEPIFLPEQLYEAKMSVQDHPLAAKSIKRRNHWEARKEAKDYLRSRALFKNWDDEMLELYISYGLVEGETGGFTLACPPRREAALFMGGMKYNPWPLLSRVKCPVLLLEGGESENRSYIDLKKASSLFPQCRYRLVPGAGHLLPMEMPGALVEIIREFFSGDGS